MSIPTNTSSTQAPVQSTQHQGVKTNAPRQPERPTYDYSGPAVFNPKLADVIATNPGAYNLGNASLLQVINEPQVRQKLNLPPKATRGQIVSAALTHVFNAAPTALNQYNKIDPNKTALAATRVKSIGRPIDLLALAKDPEGTLKIYFAAENAVAEATRKEMPTPTPLKDLNGPNLDNVPRVAAVTGIKSGWALKMAGPGWLNLTQVTPEQIAREQKLLLQSTEVAA